MNKEKNLSIVEIFLRESYKTLFQENCVLKFRNKRQEFLETALRDHLIN